MKKIDSQGVYDLDFEDLNRKADALEKQYFREAIGALNEDATIDQFELVVREAKQVGADFVSRMTMEIIHHNLDVAQQRFERMLEGRSEIEILDLCTDMYRERMNALPASQQRVVCAFSRIKCGTATAATIAKIIREDVKKVSVFLKRLEKKSIVRIADRDPKLTFRLEDDRFHSWLIMRYGRSRGMVSP